MHKKTLLIDLTRGRCLFKEWIVSELCICTLVVSLHKWYKRVCSLMTFHNADKLPRNQQCRPSSVWRLVFWLTLRCRGRRVFWLQWNLLMVVTKQCNWPSRFAGINETKFLCLWVFGNIFYRCFKTSYKSGLNDHGCVLECPPPLAILDYLIFVVFF